MFDRSEARDRAQSSVIVATGAATRGAAVARCPDGFTEREGTPLATPRRLQKRRASRSIRWLLAAIATGALMLHNTAPTTPTPNTSINALLLALDATLSTSPFGIRE